MWYPLSNPSNKDWSSFTIARKMNTDIHLYYEYTKQSNVLRKKVPKKKDNVSGFSTLRRYVFIQRN